MEIAVDAAWTMTEQDRKLSETVERERGRLRNFIRRRVPDEAEAEDILQDVFYELVEAYRLMKPIEQAGAWMFRVARNRIIDLFRKKKPEAMSVVQRAGDEGGESLTIEEFLPSPDAGPEAEYARGVLLDQLEGAIEELPEDQRDVFVAHEIEWLSFKEISAETGVSVNTLLSRKHHAVLHLRRRLQSIYDEFTNQPGGAH
jgi:RNA polymerase sigma factor (sigma-70 family)